MDVQDFTCHVLHKMSVTQHKRQIHYAQFVSWRALHLRLRFFIGQ